MMLRRVALAAVFALAPSLFAARQGGPIPVQLPLFPGNNWWNTDITNAPLDGESAAMITFINNSGNRALHPDFGGDVGDGSGETYGIPFIVVDDSQPTVIPTFGDYDDESDHVPYPIPDEAITLFGWIEGGEPGNQDPGGDRHMLIVNRSQNTLYEMGNVFYDATTGWNASGGSFFDMKTNDRRPDGWTSADAAGLAILPGLVRYDESVDLPEINHAFRVTVRSTRDQYYFPASHEAGGGTTAPWMGMRLRLKPGTVINPALPNNVKRILNAMKRYGLIVADNGSDMYISGTYDTRWDNGVLNPAFGALHANDFEVIQKAWQPPVVLLLTTPALSGGTSQSVTVKVVNSSGVVQTGYTGTIHFSSVPAGAVLPANYAFTGGDAGQHTFAISSLPAGYTSVTATDTTPLSTITGSVLVHSGPRAPTGLVATVATPTQVNLSWEPSAGGAASYIVQRRNGGGAYATITCTVVGTACQDSGVSGPNAYVYRVCADSVLDPANACSLPDVATIFTFTDDPIVPGVTRVKANHIAELQDAINKLLETSGDGDTTFTPASSDGAIEAVQLQELQDALDTARQHLGLAPNSRHDCCFDETVNIKAPNVQELRDGTK